MATHTKKVCDVCGSEEYVSNGRIVLGATVLLPDKFRRAGGYGVSFALQPSSGPPLDLCMECGHDLIFNLKRPK